MKNGITISSSGSQKNAPAEEKRLCGLDIYNNTLSDIG